MKIERGRAVISVEDNPVLIASAIDRSIPANNASEAITADKDGWYHCALNNSEALADHFGMHRESYDYAPHEWFPASPEPYVTTMSTRELELVLVMEGLRRIDEQSPVEPIEDVLQRLDAARTSSR